MKTIISILFENDTVLVINKPAGILVHPDGKNKKETIVDWIQTTHPEIVGVGEPMMIGEALVERPGIVHRLDEETSGVLVIAKTQKMFEHLKLQFQQHLVEKEYHAFVWGHFKEIKGTIDVPIGRNRADFRRWHAGRGTRGDLRDALTTWVAEHQFFDEKKDQFSFVRLFPATGRTHQLRVHMKFIQRPIVSDRLYAPTKPQVLGFTRVALHAHTISFFDEKGQKITVSAPYPEDFEHAIAKYVKP